MIDITTNPEPRSLETFSSHLNITKFIASRTSIVLVLMNLFTPKSKFFNKTVIQKQGKTWWRVVERSILHIRKPMLYQKSFENKHSSLNKSTKW